MKRFLLSAALLLACSGVALAQESEFSGGGGGGITAAPGSGTAGRVPQFASTTSLEDSKMLTSGTNSGTWTLYDNTAVTGVSQLYVRDGAGQASSPQLVLGTNGVGVGLSIYARPSTAYVDFRDGNAGSYINIVANGLYGGSGGWGLEDSSNALVLSSGSKITWQSAANYYSGSPDIGLARSAAGILKITDGSTGQGGIGISDAATNTVTDALILRHATTATVGDVIAGFGTGLLFQGEDAAGNMQDMASIDAVYTDATNGSEDSKLVLQTIVAGAMTDAVTIAANLSTGHPGISAAGNLHLVSGADMALFAASGIAFAPSGGGGAMYFTSSGLGAYNNNTYDIGGVGGAFKSAYVSTSIQGTRSKVLTDNTITDVVQISSATTDRVTAGHVSYTVYASDATNHLVQTETGEVPFLLVNENGTVTVTLGTVYGTAIDSAGGAALTNTFASSVSGTDAKIRVTSNYDQATLTGTVTHTIEYRVYIDSGTATVTPQ